MKKWLSVKNNIQRKQDIVTNFSDSHNYYASAYRYVCKTDEYVFHSINHPDLSEVGSHRTKQCTEAYRSSRKRSSAASQQSTPAASGSKQLSYDESTPVSRNSTTTNRKLSNLEVGDYVTKNNIVSKKQLYAHAEKRKVEGECDLAIYLFSRSDKFIKELICKAWLMKTAGKELTVEAKSRLQRVKEAMEEDCSCSPDCPWLPAALELLKLNNIDVKEFARAIYDLMSHGRGKFRNLMLVGRSNCAKTFMLKPLKMIFPESIFENPSRDKFGWIGAQNARVMLLQDFRYAKEMIAWNDLLLLLERDDCVE